MDKNAQYPSTFDGLLHLARDLRGPDGCPWDREQTRDSMKRYIQEECYELLEAIDEGVAAKIAEELGDVLFHMAFQVNLGVEDDAFAEEQVFGTLIEKLVRRHPHVFGDAEASDARAIESSWHVIKRAEKEMAGTKASTMDGVPGALPALSHAHAIQERAARAGFDWEQADAVLEKVGEELAELQAADSADEREAEFGDLLFSIVNAGRWMDLDAESALRKADARFRGRYHAMERLSGERGVTFERLTPDEKEALWQEAKAVEG